MAGKRKLTDAQLEEYRRAFKLFDKDGDGRISSVELRDVMTSLGQTPFEHEVDAMIKAVDTDKNGFVDFDEFLRMMTVTIKENSTPPMNVEELKNAFKMFDTDNSGTITAQEIRVAVGNAGIRLSDSEIADMIRVADKNGDGVINYSEFIGAMQKK